VRTGHKVCGNALCLQALFEHLQTRSTGVPSASSFSRQAAQKAAVAAASRTGPLGTEFSLASGDSALLRSSAGSAVPDSPVSQAGSNATVSLLRV
jgi:hypothetical protein